MTIRSVLIETVISPTFFSMFWIFKFESNSSSVMMSKIHFHWNIWEVWIQDLSMKIFQKLHMISISFAVISHPKELLRAQWHQNSMTVMWETFPKLTQKWPKNHCSFDFLKLFLRFERNFPQLFYAILEFYMCQASKLYGWDLRNKAKVSPKMTKKWPVLDFSIFSSSTFWNNWSLSTPYKGLICAISSKWHEWDSSESEGKRPNPTPLPHMRLLFSETT